MYQSRVIVEQCVRWKLVPARGASVISEVVLRHFILLMMKVPVVCQAWYRKVIASIIIAADRATQELCLLKMV